MTSRPTRAACIQLRVGTNRDDNIDRATALVQRAADAGAEIVLLPEKWNCYGSAEALRANAEDVTDGPTVGLMANWAREHAMTVIGGSITELRPGQDKLSNTSLVFGPDGQNLATYRKIHMFDVDVGGTRYRESDLEAGGEQAVLLRVGDWSVGLSICYDLRFPELYRELAVEGAEVLAVPSAFTAVTGRAHWELLLRARAVENQCFVIAANQWGTDGIGRETYGHSMIVDPWGEILAEAESGKDTVVVADLDRERLAQVRASIPSLANRRPRAYGRLVPT